MSTNETGDAASENNNVLTDALKDVKCRLDGITSALQGPPTKQQNSDKETSIDSEYCQDQSQSKDEKNQEMVALDLASLNLQVADITACFLKLSHHVEDLSSVRRKKDAETAGLLTDNGLREQMATRTYSFMRIWCTFVGVIIFFYVAANQFNPPKEVIIALMGTTTISIVGLVGFVVSGLFKSNNKVDK